MKRGILFLVIVLASISVGSAFAITIRLAGDVTIDGTLDVVGPITIPNPTIDNLQGQIINLGGTGGTTPINAATLDGLDSTDLVKSNQSCQVGQLITGFDVSGNEICKEIKLVRDTLNGLGRVDLVSESDRTSVVIGTDGNPVISYYDESVRGLEVLHCTTPSCSFFDTPTTIEDTSGVGNGIGSGSSIAIGTDGFPVIAYRDSTNFDIKLVHCTNISCSSFDTPIILEDGDGSTSFDGHVSIDIGTDGFPVIAYALTGTSNEIRFIHCTNISCSSSDAFQTLDTNTVDFPSITIGSDNNPIVSYVGSSDSVKVAHCSNTTCTSAITVTTIEDPVEEFIDTDIALGTDGNAVIHYSGQPGNRFVHCTNVTCSSFDLPFTIPGSDGREGSTPVAIGKDGFPVIAFLSNGLNELKITYCKDVACSDFDIVDTINDEAISVSLAIGNDGLPILSSFNNNNNLQATRAGGILLDGSLILSG